jgi:phage-related protein
MIGMQIIELVNNPGNIVIDTPRMESYTGSQNLNSSMRGDYPVLRPGSNAISWTGSVANLYIIPNWRSL